MSVLLLAALLLALMLVAAIVNGAGGEQRTVEVLLDDYSIDMPTTLAPGFFGGAMIYGLDHYAWW